MVRVCAKQIPARRGSEPPVVALYRCTSFQVDFEKVWTIFEPDGFLSSNIVSR